MTFEPSRRVRALDRLLAAWLLVGAPFHAWCAVASLVWALSSLPGVLASGVDLALARHPIALALTGAFVLQLSWMRSPAASGPRGVFERRGWRALALASLLSPVCAVAIGARIESGFPPLVKAIDASVQQARAAREREGSCVAPSRDEDTCPVDLVAADAAAPPLGGPPSGEVVVRLRDRGTRIEREYSWAVTGTELVLRRSSVRAVPR